MKILEPHNSGGLPSDLPGSGRDPGDRDLSHIHLCWGISVFQRAEQDPKGQSPVKSTQKQRESPQPYLWGFPLSHLFLLVANLRTESAVYIMLKQHWVKGKHYWDSALRILNKMYPELLEARLQDWLDSYFGKA